jgi:kexin
MINPDDPDWEDTYAGRRYSYKYGFGAIDGYAYVTAAQKWKLVKPQSWIETPTIQLANGTMNKDGDMDGGQDIGPGGVRSTMTITQEMLESNNFEKLEHINVKVWITHTKRGDVEVEVVSPNGIKSVLGGTRKRDRSDTGFPGWTFMTVKHW